MPHVCEFVPSQRLMRMQMQVSMSDSGQAGMGSGIGNAETIVEWRCKFCLRRVNIEDVPPWGIAEGFDRAEAIRDWDANAPKITEDQLATAVADVKHDAGALTPEEQAELLARSA